MQLELDYWVGLSFGKYLGNGLFFTAFCPYFLHLYPSSRWSTSLLVMNAYLGSLSRFWVFFFGFDLNRKKLKKYRNLSFWVCNYRDPFINYEFPTWISKKKHRNLRVKHETLHQRVEL